MHLRASWFPSHSFSGCIEHLAVFQLLVSEDSIWRLLAFLLLLLSNTSATGATKPRDLLFNLGIRCHDVSALLINECLEQVPSLQSVLLIAAQMLSSWRLTVLVYRNPAHVIPLWLIIAKV